MAKRFRFRLQTLLRVRELREQEAERKVAAQRAEIARLDDWNRQTAQEIEQHQQSLRHTQSGQHFTPLDLVRTRAWIAHLRSTMAARSVQRGEMLKQLEKLMDDWRITRQNRRVIEKLRERRWDEYVHGREQEEQAAADELAQQMQAFDW